MNTNRVVLIVVYIGKLPDFFKIWLNSCRFNPQIDWLIYTDDTQLFEYPKNVKPVYTSFSQIKELFQSKYSFPISLDSHVKLCDYKTAYGDIFNEEIKNYDYWGYCDIDVVWGNISHFIEKYNLLEYDKACDTGHFTLYKNTEELRTLYKKGKEKGLLDYQEVFTHPKIYAFDEWGLSVGINAIFLAHNKTLFYETIVFADIEVYSYSLRTTRISYGKDVKNEVEKESIIYQFVNGRLYQHYKKGNKLYRNEEMYIHLQKRPMKYASDLNLSSFLIVAPDKMISWPFESAITVETLQKYGSNRKKYWSKIFKEVSKRLKSPFR
jgi:hypothetical protein